MVRRMPCRPLNCQSVPSRPGLTLESGRSYPLDVDALVRGKGTTIVRFQLHVPEASDLGRFLPYSNDHEVMAALLDPKP